MGFPLCSSARGKERPGLDLGDRRKHVLYTLRVEGAKGLAEVAAAIPGCRLRFAKLGPPASPMEA